MKGSYNCQKTNHDICIFVKDLFAEIGVLPNEQILLWEMSKYTIGCKKLMCILLLLKKQLNKQDEKILFKREI